MKFRTKNNNALILIIGFVTLSSMAAITQYTLAIDNTNPSQFMDLGNPLLVQHYHDTAGKPETTDNNTSASFTGEGKINGTVNITAEGNGTETFRSNDTSYIQGEAKYVTDNKDIATYNFYAIGNYHPDGSFGSNGIAIFDDGATGELSFLSNLAGIYKDQVDKNGTGTFLMWHWR
jgi:hypothetical protein